MDSTGVTMPTAAGEVGRHPILWSLGVIVAPLVPTLVFWGSVMASAFGPEIGWLMPVVSGTLIVVGGLLTLARSGIMRAVGAGLAAGGVPCLLWSAWMGS